MEAQDIAKLFLADWLVERFDIVRGDVNDREERMDIWLDEKKILPADSFLRASEVISYGFTSESVIQDFPIRGNAVYLHIRRRKWQEMRTGKVYAIPLDVTYRGTRLTKELVAFLKSTN